MKSLYSRIAKSLQNHNTHVQVLIIWKYYWEKCLISYTIFVASFPDVFIKGISNKFSFQDAFMYIPFPHINNLAYLIITNFLCFWNTTSNRWSSTWKYKYFRKWAKIWCDTPTTFIYCWTISELLIHRNIFTRQKCPKLNFAEKKMFK